MVSAGIDIPVAVLRTALPVPFNMRQLYVSLVSGYWVSEIMDELMINGAQDVVLLAVNCDFGLGYTVMFLSVVSRQPCLLVPINRTVSTLSF